MGGPPGGPMGGPPYGGPPGYPPQPGMGPAGFQQMGPPPQKKSGCGTALAIVGGIFLVMLLAAGGLGYWIYDRVKTAERTRETERAKSQVRELARMAKEAYEDPEYDYTSSSMDKKYRLCGSATPVPDHIPKSKFEQNSSDFSSGTKDSGWKCLKGYHYISYFGMFQLEYRVGKDYKGKQRGGPDPGADGFEISAEADLDQDGTTSLITMTGKVDKKTNKVTLDKDVYIADEGE